MTVNQDGSTRSVNLPEHIVSRVETRLPGTEWDTPDEYITHVMDEVLTYVETENATDGFESVDEREVRDRLEALGYLNE